MHLVMHAGVIILAGNWVCEKADMVSISHTIRKYLENG